MERLHSSGAVPPHLRGGVLALGNFDGFHLGHQAVVGHAMARARAEGRPCIVATFDPHPIGYFQPDAPPFRLTSLDQRAQLFASAGSDAMLVIGFDRAMAETSAEGFVRYLVERMGIAVAVTGTDFTFGAGRTGNVGLLAQLGVPLGLAADAVPPVADDNGAIISSTRIREALHAGDCAEATRLLTRPFTILGEVEHGAKMGRELGYPTANVALSDYLRPSYGVYAVRARLANGVVLDGAANLGIRPQFHPPKELFEPYFFEFSGDLYGQRVEVQFIERIRGEARFDSLDHLKAQIADDCEKARRILAAHPATF